MTRKLAFLVSMILATPAFAATEVVYINPFESSFSLFADATRFSIDSIRVVNAPTKLEVDADCGSDLELCDPSKTLESVDAVLVRVNYEENTSSSSEDTGRRTLDAYFPADHFSADALARIRKASDYFLDPFGKKGRALKKLANELIDMSVTETTEIVSVIDSGNSRFCEIGEYSCEEIAVYKNVDVRKKHVELSIR